MQFRCLPDTNELELVVVIVVDVDGVVIAALFLLYHTWWWCCCCCRRKKIIKQFAKQTKHDIEMSTSIKCSFHWISSKTITGNDDGSESLKTVPALCLSFSLPLLVSFDSCSHSISRHVLFYSKRNTWKEKKENKRKLGNDMVYIVVTLNIAL